MSGQLADRVDIKIEVQAVRYEEMTGKRRGETSAEVRARVNAARRFALSRFASAGLSDQFCNAAMTPRQIRQFCVLEKEAEQLLKTSFERLGLSARGYDKILRVARTIADLDGSESITARHVAEAVQFRSLDRSYFSN